MRSPRVRFSRRPTPQQRSSAPSKRQRRSADGAVKTKSSKRSRSCSIRTSSPAKPAGSTAAATFADPLDVCISPAPVVVAILTRDYSTESYELNRQMRVIKMRGSHHEQHPYRLTIESGGLKVKKLTAEEVEAEKHRGRRFANP